ncbi:signal peptidase I [Leptonema illini]|uniref:Signal peptidase I n=1 Tax=Leptonema illini DSM 21528 TaxID=929563 RepID=H2CJ41_9LEPT|nr:signal peptidase I [Leptonema illini]EHQ04958.1 signal peptidase I [Leptonema illini DSM 21528]
MKRKIIAVALNLLLFPFGYYYLKQPRRFFLMALVSLFLVSLLRGGLMLSHLLLGGIGAAATFFLTVFALYALIMLDTMIVGGRPASDNRFFRLPHALWVVPLVFILKAAGGYPFDLFTEKNVASAHNIVSSSMEPTLFGGDYIYVRRIMNEDQKARGKLVVWQHVEENGPERKWLKRIIGIPGDTVVLREKNTENGSVLNVFVNGQSILDEKTSHAVVRRVDEPFTLYQEGSGEKKYWIQEGAEDAGQFVANTFVLGPDQYFLMGDNRDDSKDSRYLGPVSADRITHEYMFHYFSIDWQDDLRHKRKIDSAHLQDSQGQGSATTTGLAKWKRMKIRWDRIGIVVD